jgi:hypothetical protein
MTSFKFLIEQAINYSTIIDNYKSMMLNPQSGWQ